MRIQKIIYKEHPFFSEDFVINFENDWKIADITYLVGDNWSWKTQILNNIAEAFSSIYHYSWYIAAVYISNFWKRNRKNTALNQYGYDI